MLEFILSQLISYLPVSIGYLFVAFISGMAMAGLLVFYAMKMHYRVSRLEDSKDGHGTEIKEIHSRLKVMDKLVGAFNNLVHMLSEKNAINDANHFTVNSPIGLTGKARQMLEDIGWNAQMEIEDNRRYLFGKLDALNLKTKYDVEKAAINVVFELSGKTKENLFTPIKKHLYEHAEIEDFTAIMACGIDLRDRYLTARPEMKE